MFSSGSKYILFACLFLSANIFAGLSSTSLHFTQFNSFYNEDTTQIAQAPVDSTKSSPINTPAIVKLTMAKPYKQGGSIIVDITSDTPLVNPKASFMGRDLKIFKIKEGQYKSFIGTEATAKPGGYTLKLTDDTGNLNYTETINVCSGSYPIQNIRISGGKASLEPTKDELQKVNNAKSNITGVKLYTDKPFKSPTVGCVASVYGLNRFHNGKATGDYHKGQDIKAPQGQNIVATTDGKVLIAEQFRLHGGTVAIDHGHGLMSIYIHMSKITAKPGEIVKKGQKIGEIGSTGFATGPHLHWGLYIFGTPVNPAEWTGWITRC